MSAMGSEPAIPRGMANHSAVIRITDGGGSCSGVIISKGEEISIGLSAAHCSEVKVGETAWFHLDSPLPQPKCGLRWLAFDEENDLALFRCWTKDIKGTLPILKNVPRNHDIFMHGYPRGQKDQVTRKYIESTKPYGGNSHWKWYSLMEGIGIYGGDSGGAIRAETPKNEGLIGLINRSNSLSGADRVGSTKHSKLVQFVLDNLEEMPVDCRQGCFKDWQYIKPVPEKSEPDNSEIEKLRAEIAELRKYVLENAKPGKDGAPGKDGVNGKDGMPGQNGTNGKDAEFPPDLMKRIDQLEKENASLRNDVRSLTDKIDKILSEKMVVIWKDSEGEHRIEYKFPYRMKFDFSELD